jgi:hypothetical protein
LPPVSTVSLSIVASPPSAAACTPMALGPDVTTVPLSTEALPPA